MRTTLPQDYLRLRTRHILELLDEDLSGPDGPERLNHAVEGLIRHCPEQYLWSYNRYKVPKGVAPPGQEPPV